MSAGGPAAAPRPRRSPRHHINRARQTLARFPSSLTLLAARIAMAVLFFQSGFKKLGDWPVTLELFAGDYHVPLLPPATAAVVATCLELGGATLLALGLGARLGAAALLGMILVVQLFVYPENWPDHIVWGTLLLAIVVHGPGEVSIDRYIARYWLDRD